MLQEELDRRDAVEQAAPWDSLRVPMSGKDVRSQVVCILFLNEASL